MAIAGMDTAAIAPAAEAAKAIAEMTSYIPNEGGIVSWFTGENSVASWAKQLPVLGLGLKLFSMAIAGMDVTSITPAVEAAKAIAGMTSIIPNEGGIVAWFTGDNSISHWSDELWSLGNGLMAFSEAVTGINITSIMSATGAAKALADMTSIIPNEGGIAAWFAGDNSITKWSSELPVLGNGLKAFSDSLEGVNVANITIAAIAAKILAEMANTTPEDTSHLNTFGKNLVKFGGKIKEFVAHMSGTTYSSLMDAIQKIRGLIALSKMIASENIESLKTFGDSLKKFAKDGVNGFVDEFSGSEPVNKAKEAVGKLVKSCIDGADDKKSSVKDKFEEIAKAAIKAMNTKTLKEQAASAGKDLVQGFANGIKNNKSLASDAGSSIGKAALAAAKEAIDSNSPSKEAMYLGNFFGEGFVIGIKEYGSKVYDTSYSVADRAKLGLSNAIAKITDMINSDMDTQPTIRPVLDLSDVESGAGYLSSMFNSGPSIGVAANLRAISSGMNTKVQNGTSNDVVSAINKLRKDLSVKTNGDTYNINGITYDDGSNITDAVQTLVRAARIERRV